MEMLKGVKDKNGVEHGFGFAEVKVAYVAYNGNVNVPYFLLTYISKLQEALSKGEISVVIDNLTKNDFDTLCPIRERGCYTTIPDKNNHMGSENGSNVQIDFIVGLNEYKSFSTAKKLVVHFLDPLSVHFFSSLCNVAKTIDSDVDGNLHLIIGNGYIKLSLKHINEIPSE